MTTEVTQSSLISFSTVLEPHRYRLFFSLNIVVVSHKFGLMVVECLSVEKLMVPKVPIICLNKAFKSD